MQSVLNITTTKGGGFKDYNQSYNSTTGASAQLICRNSDLP